MPLRLSSNALLSVTGLFAAGSALLVACEGGSGPRNEEGQRGVGMSRLYSENCAKCHGEKGEGGGAGTKTLLTRELFEQTHDRPFFAAIKIGVPNAGMDAYGQTMSDEEIWGLVVHIRELQARAIRAQYGSPTPQNGVYRSQRASYSIQTVLEGRGLSTPWSIDWLPTGEMLVTNRNGRLFIVQNGAVVADVKDLPASVEMGQGGLMEVAVHPQYAKNGWIYLSLTDPAKGARGGMTKIVRGKLSSKGADARWFGQQTIFEAAESTYNGSGVHFGSRIVFDGAGHIFFSIGERGSQELAQDLSKPNGKIYRVNEDGSIPSDNPFVGTANAIPAIWSYGHRNPQGLVRDLQGTLWDTEHGPRGGDELNVVRRGSNYGWPLVAFSINYNDAAFRTPWPKADQKIDLPAYRWLPSIGASGLDVARGKAFPGWQGDLLAGGLSGQNLDRIRTRNGAMLEREELLQGMGRVRDVSVHPDGSVYVALNGPDKIIRLVPAP